MGNALTCGDITGVKEITTQIDNDLYEIKMLNYCSTCLCFTEEKK
jgi:hypothetical protein